MEKPKLRIGLLINDYITSAWSYRLVELIQRSEHSSIELIVRKDTSDRKRNIGLLGKIWNLRTELFFIIYLKIEKFLFRPTPNAFAVRDLRDIVNCAELSVKPKETKFSDRILKKDIAEIKSKDIDVFIRLGFRILRGDILTSSKYGVWSFHHGDNRVNRGGPAGAWEVLECWDSTGVTLQVLSEDLDGGQVITRTISSTDDLSILRNKNNYYWKAISLIPRALKVLYSQGDEVFYENLSNMNVDPDFYYKRLYRSPTNINLLSGVLNNYSRAFKRKWIKLLYLDQWILLYSLSKKPVLSTTFYRFKRLVPPKDRFWADPFVVFKDNKYFIYIEELPFSTGKGHISLLEMDQKGNYKSPITILERPYHLSYPFIYEEGDELYMIPESSENSTIELYKCVNFPNQWKYISNLMEDICAVDSTILKHDEKYWMFTNIREQEGASTCDELFLFYSDTLNTKKWTSHPMNPVVSDVRCSRSAGNIFIHNNQMYRPAQDCGKHYGHGMKLMKITELSETTYIEIESQSIYPDWSEDIRSTHTLNHSNRLTFTDGLMRRSRLS